MKIYHSISSFTAAESSSNVTIGTFDGVHIGHQAIIKNLIDQSQSADTQSVILTFFPHPRMVLQKGSNIKLLTTLEEKIDRLTALGLDCLIIEPFTKDFSRLTARDFVRKILIDQLKLKKLIIGYDHQFGRNREGDFDQLKEFGSVYNFELEEITAQDVKNIAVSSTKIRAALMEGDITKANEFLAYPYPISGTVIRGKGLGKQHDYPTINISVSEDYKLIPKSGVYVVKATVQSRIIAGIMNIGFRPTINGKNQTIEVHLLDFKGDLYGTKIKVELLTRLRDEQKFDSLDGLFAQIKKDESQARQLLSDGKNSL